MFVYFLYMFVYPYVMYVSEFILTDNVGIAKVTTRLNSPRDTAEILEFCL